MLVIAVVCVALGSWQIARLQLKHDDNDILRANAHKPAQPISAVLAPGAHPSTDQIDFRQVRAQGVYDAADQLLVRQRNVGDDTGYLVLTPMRMDSATVLVVRGFISGGGTATVTAPAPPTGPVTVSLRLRPAETGAERLDAVPAGQVDSINPAAQATRLGTTVLDGYGELLGGQAGSAGLVAVPSPDLSNPAGGAVEPQHLAYIIQWYLFAALALAAPFAMARADSRHAEADSREIDDIDEIDELPPVGELDRAPRAALPATPSAEQARTQRLADRYGR